ncbi:MAG: DUF348 domain-containing protein [Chloroflexi bacterium]|nr:DUF348 domain-containing protein [Chloroflexota bacterium]
MAAEKAITQPWVDEGPAPRPMTLSQRGWLTWPMGAILVIAMVWGYFATQRWVQIVIDGQRLTLKTHQTSVAGLLAEIGLALGPEDTVLPRLEAYLEGQEIVVDRARPVVLNVDHRTIALSTHADTVGEILQEAGIALQLGDLVFIDGQEVGEESPLPAINFGSGLTVSPVKFEILRSLALQVFDGGVPQQLETLSPTVGQALWESGIPVFQGDLVQPALQTPLSNGMRVYIQRATPLTIWADGRRILTLTQGQTIGEALAGEFVFLTGKDYTIPAPDTYVSEDLQVQVVRVQEKFVLEEEPIPYDTRWQPDPERELDQWQIVVAGQPGLTRRIVREVYENGELKQRITERQWVETTPTTQVTAYGTKIVLRELETSEGVIRYWRKIRMLATSYTAATSGKSRDHPAYGITRLGWVATKGVIAVDPRVILLGTKMYVPGYGLGTAADTGGAILGKRIDLAYDESNLVLWYKWVEVYLLEPVPPLDEIPLVLPTYPQERR